MDFIISYRELTHIIQEIENENEKPAVMIEEVDSSGYEPESPEGSRIENLIKAVWQKIREGIYAVKTDGGAVLDASVEAVAAGIQEAKLRLGSDFHYLKSIVESRLIKVRNGMFKAAIRSFPKELSDSEIKYCAESFSISLEVKAGGDIKASFTEILKFMTEGKFKLDITYKKTE